MVSFRRYYKVKTTFAALFYSLSPIHCSNVTYLTHMGTLYQCSRFACRPLSLSSLLHFCLRVLTSGPYISHEAPPSWLWDNKWQYEKFTRRNQLARCSPRVLVFSRGIRNSIFLDSLFVTVWWLLEVEVQFMIERET